MKEPDTETETNESFEGFLELMNRYPPRKERGQPVLISFYQQWLESEEFQIDYFIRELTDHMYWGER